MCLRKFYTSPIIKRVFTLNQFVLISEMDGKKIKVFITIATRTWLNVLYLKERQESFEVKYEETIREACMKRSNLCKVLRREWLINSILIYDGSILDWNTTPKAVGMRDNSPLLVLDKSFFAEVEINGYSIEELSEIVPSFKGTVNLDSNHMNVFGIQCFQIAYMAIKLTNQKFSANFNSNL